MANIDAVPTCKCGHERNMHHIILRYCTVCPCELYDTRPETSASAGEGQAQEIIAEEIRHLQRSFEGMGTVSDVTAEKLLRPSFQRVWSAAKATPPAPDLREAAQKFCRLATSVFGANFCFASRRVQDSFKHLAALAGKRNENA